MDINKILAELRLEHEQLGRSRASLYVPDQHGHLTSLSRTPSRQQFQRSMTSTANDPSTTVPRLPPGGTGPNFAEAT